MDKNAIKKFAIWARRELIERVSQRAAIYGITSEDYGEPEAESVNGKLLSANEKNQRKILINNIKEKGFEQVIEEVAYTWFNRFAALRFMEVNGYLPSHIRVFTNEAGEFKPQILSEAIHLDLEGLNKDKVYELENDNKTEELFKYLLVVQCNALNSILPGMFQRIDDYTELLLPDNLLREGSVIEKLVIQGTSDSIPESDWTDQVQIIGWLYESYNTERNETVYDGSLSKERISKDYLPAATTIFTPDWPVHYMVENSLGRLWLEGHPNDSLKSEWKYYLDEAEQEPEVQEQLEKIRKEYAGLKLEEIRVIDPCSGSGHILCVLFDALIQIYESHGYSARDAACSIVTNNLWGLDIDNRAAQLSYFTIMMKARQYDRRFLSKNIRPHVYGITETNVLKDDLNKILQLDDFSLDKKHIDILEYLSKIFVDAKEYGSIIKLKAADYLDTKQAWDSVIQTKDELPIWSTSFSDRILVMIEQAIALTQKYHVVITNPPYLGSSRFSPLLDRYVKDNYSDVKSDLSMVMYKHAIDDMVIDNGFVAFITTTSWMFLSSFEKLRQHAQKLTALSSLVDFGTELFDGKVGHNPIVSWVVRNSKVRPNFYAVRLVDYCYSLRDKKEKEFFNEKNKYIAQQDDFSKIPGSPIVYWLSDTYFNFFNQPKLIELAKPRQGLATGENDKFVRFWYECDVEKENFVVCSIDESILSGSKWFPYNKGGEYRKWYGNNDYVVNWFNDGYEIRHFTDSKGKLRSRPQNTDAYFKECFTWSKISSGSIAFRYKPFGHVFDVAGTSFFADHDILLYLGGLCNSKVATSIFSAISPTLNYEVGHIAALPVILDDYQKDSIKQIVNNNILLSRDDWDSYETSWDFKQHPLVIGIYKDITENRIEQAFITWQNDSRERFSRLKQNEEALNRIFIGIYGLQDELSSEVGDKDITVRKADLQRDIKSFISYAVGCMFGRYSLDIQGLVYAGGIWDPSKYPTFPADEDAIIPICDDEYFEDDIVGLFITFVEKVYGKETLEENLQFIADALGGKGTSREIIRNYFMNGFYSDHVKVYQKRPIYWLFDSGKKNGFKCLIYLHRYKPDTIARIRTDYIHEQQSRYRTAIEDLNRRIDGALPSEKVKLNKQLTKVMDQAEEIRVYEEKIHHLADQMIEIDLDDGVKVNYAKFQDVLAKIK